DHADIGRTAVHNVDLVLFAVGRNARWLAADAQGPGQFKGTEIDDADGVALAIGDIAVLAKRRPVTGQRLFSEIPPSDRGKDGKKHSDEEKFSQVSVSRRKRLAEIQCNGSVGHRF